MSSPAVKLQEFVAHGSNVNCLRLGPRSGRLLATGGEDRLVNLWEVGRAANVASLQGHQSAVECLAFDPAEETIAAGSQGGSVKCFSLREGRCFRTLSGHMSNCASLDFHPYGEFVASGSLDTNLKIWDVRHKACIQTYKGHAREVTSVRFSPDGRWVASGGRDGQVKVWDLTAGRLLSQFRVGSEVTTLCFHPEEFLLAAGGADRCLRFFDLETFDPLCVSAPDSSPVRAVAFAPDGEVVVAAAAEGLRLWSWEPEVLCHDAAEVGWAKVADAHVDHDRKLLGAGFQDSFVSVWLVDLNQLRPYDQSQQQLGHAERARVARQQQTQVHGQPRGQQQYTDSTASHSDSTPAYTTHSGGVQRMSPMGFHAVPQSHAAPSAATVSPLTSSSSTLTPSSSLSSSSSSSSARSMLSSLTSASSAPSMMPQQVEQSTGSLLTSHSSEANPRPSPMERLTSPMRNCGLGGDSSPVSQPLVLPHSHTDPDSSSALVPSSSSIRNNSADAQHHHMVGSSVSDVSYANSHAATSSANPSPEAPSLSTAVVPAGPVTEVPASPSSSTSSFSSSSSSSTLSSTLSSSAALPTHSGGPTASPLKALHNFTHTHTPAATAPASELELLHQISAESSTFLVAMENRLLQLRLIKKHWARGQVSQALQQLRESSMPVRQMVAVDFLRAADLRCRGFNLEGCAQLLPVVVELVHAEFEEYVRVALLAGDKLLKMFAPVIKNTLHAASNASARVVDLGLEDRRSRCEQCYQAFGLLGESLQQAGGPARFPALRAEARSLQNGLRSLSTR